MSMNGESCPVARAVEGRLGADGARRIPVQRALRVYGNRYGLSWQLIEASDPVTLAALPRW